MWSLAFSLKLQDFSQLALHVYNFTKMKFPSHKAGHDQISRLFPNQNVVFHGQSINTNDAPQ